MNNISIEKASQLLKQNDDILILCHRSPDGDTLGSGYGLYYALTSIGKRCRVECSDEITKKFQFITLDYNPQEFEEQFIVAVDIADTQLLGSKTEIYKDKVDLCIDHHPSNTGYSKYTLLEPHSAATTEVIKLVIEAMGVDITESIANCLYLGMCTDTGCFKYSNTSPRTHRFAAELMEKGADYADINRVMFDTKTKAQIAVEKLAMDTLEFFYGDRCAVMVLTNEMMEKSGATSDDTEALASLPRQIEGIEVGVLLKQRLEEGKPEGYKISVRTSLYVDASQLCADFGGGGHKRAGGCFIEGDYEYAKQQMVTRIGNFLQESTQL